MLLAGLAALLLVTAPASAQEAETLDLTSGADGAADNAVISRDTRVATVVAFD